MQSGSFNFAAGRGSLNLEQTYFWNDVGNSSDFCGKRMGRMIASTRGCNSGWGKPQIDGDFSQTSQE